MGLIEQAIQFLSSIDEYWIQAIALVVKFVVVLLISLHVPPLMVWAERRAPAMMQRRKGPNRVGLFKWRLFGLMQPLADTVKLIFKEEVVPDKAHKFFFHLAPVFSVFPALLIVTAIPFGHDMTIGPYTFSMSITKLDVGFLFILALSSIGVYGIALAGWASNNKYSLLGGLRSSAQMISYEIPMGMSLIPMVLIYGTFDLNDIVLQQANLWGVFLAPLSFVLFLVCMFAETNRAPFDLAEGESEIVGGYLTEYGTFKFSAFFLAEYVAMFVLSCLASTFFFGGWQIPFVSYDMLVQLTGFSFIASLIGMVVLLIKAAFFMWLFVWVRWTLPRFRYDQLMGLGWKFLMPVALANIVITAAVLVMLPQ
jgi:NADH-quinone oxidoreductase subunit H